MNDSVKMSLSQSTGRGRLFGASRLAGILAAGLLLAACGQGAANGAPAASVAASTAPASSPAAASNASAKPSAAAASAAVPASAAGGANASAKPAVSGAATQQFGGGDPQGTPVKISYTAPGVTSLAFYTALSQGFFQQQHVNVTMILMPNNVAMAALSKGEIDFSNDPGGLMEANMRGLPFKVLFSAWDKANWTLMGKNQYKTIQELKGKTLGTNLVGSSPYFYLQAGLKSAGMTVNDVHIVSAPGTNVTYQQLTAGNVEAAVLSAPTDAMAQQQGFHEILFLGGFLQLPNIGLGSNTDYIKAHRPTVVALLRALLDANTWLAAHPTEAAGIIAKYTGTPADIAKLSADKMVPLLSKTGEISPQGLEQAITLQSELAKTEAKVKPEDLVDFGPLHEAAAQAK